jgi:hypothetical protein
MKLSDAFWRGFWEGLNPMWSVAWILYGIGHLVCLLGNRCHVPGMYRPYNRLMLWSLAICRRFGFSSPWECEQ